MKLLMHNFNVSEHYTSKQYVKVTYSKGNIKIVKACSSTSLNYLDLTCFYCINLVTAGNTNSEFFTGTFFFSIYNSEINRCNSQHGTILGS